jgi:hypothetical protein
MPASSIMSDSNNCLFVCSSQYKKNRKLKISMAGSTSVSTDKKGNILGVRNGSI